MNKDHYKTLGIKRSATSIEIKKAYRNLAKELHPDKNNGDLKKNDQFKSVSNAYDILGNEEKRKNYDLYGEAKQQTARPPNSFSSFFGGGPRPFAFNQGGGFGMFRGSEKSRINIFYSLGISLEEVLVGVTKTLKYSRNIICSKCKGHGGETNGDVVPCNACLGTGYVTTNQGPIIVRLTCPRCLGSQKIINKPCNVCNGSGLQPENLKTKIIIPKGIPSGGKLISRGGGHEDRFKNRGDLIIGIVYKEHSIYEIASSPIGYNNITMVLPLPFHIALIGGELQIPTLHGKTTIKIPKKSHTGMKINVPSKGLPNSSGNFGNLVVVFNVELPKKIDPDVEKALSSIIIDKNTYPEYTRVKNYKSTTPT